MHERDIIKPYNRAAAIEYAHTWSSSRNPRYLDFSLLGGDCTNFISQCLYTGSGVMNFTPVYGWYYISASNRSASWTGARFLYKFLMNNKGPGPFAREVNMFEILPADIIQLSKQEGPIYHSLFIVEIGSPPDPSNILVATHTFDVDYTPLANYDYEVAHFMHIEGVRT
jgi:hypothetical protein